MEKQIGSHDFEEIYKDLDIDLNKLGCIMLALDGSVVPDLPESLSDCLHYSGHKDRFWIDGFVAGKTPHVTLLYGLMESGQKYKKYVLDVLNDWDAKDIEIESIGTFPSPYKDEQYYCIVAHAKVTPNLLEGHNRLELLPHINTFIGYKPHMTIAYIKKDDKKRDEIIAFYEKALVDKKIPVEGYNFGGNKE